jgi:uncharacterized protein (TIGR00730 family)
MQQLRLHQRLASEVLTSQGLMHNIGESVSLFGGSRVKKDSIHYNAARETGRLLSEAGISIITGGGPGIMEAGNEGARLGKNGKSVGLVITLPFEETANPHLDLSITFEHFASRKVTFCRYSKAFVFFPGGAGTLDELYEVLALMSTGKMPESPVLMYDSQFWHGLIEWMRGQVVRLGLMSESVLDGGHARFQKRTRTCGNPVVSRCHRRAGARSSSGESSRQIDIPPLMRWLPRTLTLMVAIGAGIEYADGVGRLFGYLEGTSYRESLHMLALFWPTEVNKWLAFAGISLAAGPVSFWVILRKTLPADKQPSREKTVFALLTIPPSVAIALAFLTIPLSWLAPTLSGYGFLGLSFLTTTAITRCLLLKSASLEFFRVGEYLAWAYLPLPLLLSVVTPI